MEEVGKVTHYYSKIGVAVIELKAELKLGDRIRIKGTTTDFEQVIGSMEVEHKKIEVGKPGQAIGLKVEQRVRPGDRVYKL